MFSITNTKATLAALIIAKVCAQTAPEFDYKQNGADWPQKFPDCGLGTN